MSAVARVLAVMICLAAGAAAVPAVAQNVQQIFRTETRAFLELHWKKLAAFDPAAFDDFAPESVRSYVAWTGRGSDRRINVVGSAKGPDLRRRLQAQLAAEKAAKDPPYFTDLRLMSQTALTVRYCAMRMPTSQPGPEEYCWLIEDVGSGLYAILEDQVPARFWQAEPSRGRAPPR